MECPGCGKWAPGDASTGYDVDEICGRCARDGWTLTRDGQLLGPDDQRAPLSQVSEGPRAAIARVPRRMARARLRRRPARGASIG